MDTLRGFYVRAPAPLRRAMALPVSLMPASWRYGRNYRRWRTLIAYMAADTGARTAYVRDARAALLRHACRSPYYRAVLAPLLPLLGKPAAEIDDDAWNGVALLDKALLRQYRDALLTCDKASLDMVTTGGTSGRPTGFYLDKGRSVAEFAFINDAWSRSGYREDSARCVFRGVLIHDVERRLMEYEPGLRELRCSPFHMSDEAMTLYADEVRRRDIHYLHGYPSALAIFAAFLDRGGRAPMTDIRGIFPISESLLPHQRTLLRAVFPNAAIVPFYGMSEKAAFAVEKPDTPGTYVFNPIYGLAELLDDKGRPLARPGARGRVVSTSFMTRGMPFIRYDTEDEAELVEAPGPHNGYRLTVRGLASRWRQEFLVSRDGALVSMTAINVHSTHYQSLREFRFHQYEPGAATLEAVLADGATLGDADAFLREVSAKFGGALTLELEIRESLPATSRGKRGFIEQELDLARYGHRAEPAMQGEN